MGIIGGEIGYRLLRKIGLQESRMDGSVYLNKSKLETLLGNSIWQQISGKTVIDFGCGAGVEVVEMAKNGASRVIGVDIQEKYLQIGREHAEKAGVAERCRFTTFPDEYADAIVAIDSFEHFADPQAILLDMRRMLKPGGFVLAAFGPTWYHPLGGHLFSTFPWAHLLFTEKALIRWRSDFIADGAENFGEVEGGLNQMTIRKFERIVEQSPFRFESLEAVPIRNLRFVANRLTREFTTAIVRSKLIPRN